MDNFNLLQCQQGNDWAFTYDTGLYLEGLSVFANVTNNLTLIELYVCSLNSFSDAIYLPVSHIATIKPQCRYNCVELNENVTLDE